MRNLSFNARYPETGYWYLRDDELETYGVISEQVHHPVYDPGFGLKEQTIGEASYDVEEPT